MMRCRSSSLLRCFRSAIRILYWMIAGKEKWMQQGGNLFEQRDEYERRLIVDALARTGVCVKRPTCWGSCLLHCTVRLRNMRLNWGKKGGEDL